MDVRTSKGIKSAGPASLGVRAVVVGWVDNIHLRVHCPAQVLGKRWISGSNRAKLGA